MSTYLIKNEADLTAFLEAIKRCEDEVCFITEDGDSFNLKSLLAQWLFVVAIQKDDYQLPNKIMCSDRDYLCLQHYLE